MSEARNKKINGKTHFERTWGIKAKDLAELECVKPEALHMRVRNYGTPYQRAPMPSVSELMYNKTNVQLAREVGCHPTALSTRLKQRGTAYFSSQYQHNLGKDMGGREWKSTRWARKPKGWLHPLHPMFFSWRYHLFNMMLEGKSMKQAVAVIQEYSNNNHRDYAELWTRVDITPGIEPDDIVYPKPNLFSEHSDEHHNRFPRYYEELNNGNQ